MTWTSLKQKIKRLAEREALSPDFARAMRCMLGYMVPLVLGLLGRLPVEVIFAAIAGQSIAIVDVRGAYSLRFTLLLAMTAVLAGATGLGALTGTPLAAALAATALVAACAGLWRHLSSDYGPSLAVSSSLMFFIALALPGGTQAASHHALACLAGGMWGVLLQVALWPIRPQHPLRVMVADSWLATADLIAEIAPPGPDGIDARHQGIVAQEAALRAALDRAYSELAAAAARRGPLVPKLERLNLAAARLAMRVGAFNSAQEALASEPDFAGLAPSLQPMLKALENTARTVALSVVSRQPGHLATVNVRLQRLMNLLQALQARLRAQTDESPAYAQLGEILRQIGDHLPTLGEAVRATIERADERAAFSLELFDLHTLTLRPLASALNLTWRVDPALVRFTMRIAALTLIGVAIFKTHHLPHGYWLPFTMVVVLQPDYGATRQKAAQRVLGTLVGSILASLLLWLRLPFIPLMAVTAALSFSFGHYLKRDYGVAVVLITLFVVMLLEGSGPVSIALTAERLGSTTAGGALALLAAFVFWPVWEKDRFRPILAHALRSNGAYLRVIASRIAAGGPYDRDVAHAKRQAERSNSAIFSSLQRMMGDPKNRQDRLEQIAALANGNQRLTRALNLIALHLTPGSPLPQPAIREFAAQAEAALETLAGAVGRAPAAAGRLQAARAGLDRLRLPASASVPADAPGPRHQDWVFAQFARFATELSAMLVNLESRDSAE